MSQNNFKILNIMLSSLDGKIGFHSSESTSERNNAQFTCSEDFERMRKLVSQCDVVFHGARSIESEQGAFRVADMRASQDEPEWIIFTRSGNLSFQSSFWKQEGISKSLFFVSSFQSDEPPILQIEEKEFPFGKIRCLLGNISGLIEYLKRKGFQKAALLGGGKLNSAFYEQDLVDELYLTLSPFLVGSENAPLLLDCHKLIKKKLKLKKIEKVHDFVFLDYLFEK